jgi:hypothetical protein
VEDQWVVVTRENATEFARAAVVGARSVRVVPLTRGAHHAAASGWQVALSRPDGDVLVGQPLPNWQSARELARRVCEAASLPMDEMTEKLFSRVGRLQDGQL